MSYGVFARYYDRLTSNVEYDSIAQFLSDVMKEYKPDCSLVVDLACGTGSISVKLDAMGYDVIAVDRSYDMLSIAREKPSRRVMYLCQAMQQLDLYGTVDAVVCVLDSVNHITDERTLQKAFDRVSLFLEQDGVFIFDANTEYKHEKVLGDETFVYDMDDIYCVWQNTHGENGVTNVSLDFFEREGEAYYRSEESFKERAYSDAQLCGMLDAAGMKVAARYDNYTYNEPTETTQRVVYVCQKKD
ncbi:MAG: class I SAM-dependent methyltransferase [Clostridia bacterium]|nr:class I SAM-dependent methyltransferase [Clostridia bacterium]